MNGIREALDPARSLETWMLTQGYPEAEIVATRTSWQAWLEAMKARQQDPFVRAAQDQALRDWEAQHGNEAREKRREILRLAGVPEGLWLLALEPQRTEAVSTVAVWLATSGRWLVVSGVPGCGKSVAAAWALVENGLGRWLDVFEATRTGDGKRDKADRELWTRCERSPLLVVDDLGTEDAETRERLTRLLVARDNYGRRTIVTTNLPGEALASYDRRITDRLTGSVRRLAGESLR